MNTAQSNFSEVDLTFSTDIIPKGRSGFMGVTKRGPVNNPNILINSWPQFVKIYGDLIEGNDFPLLCKRALDGGAALRVCNIRNYGNIVDPNSLTAKKSDAITINKGVGTNPIAAVQAKASLFNSLFNPLPKVNSTGGVVLSISEFTGLRAHYDSGYLNPTSMAPGAHIIVRQTDNDGNSNPVPILDYVIGAGLDTFDEIFGGLITAINDAVDGDYSALLDGSDILIWLTEQPNPSLLNGKLIWLNFAQGTGFGAYMTGGSNPASEHVIITATDADGITNPKILCDYIAVAGDDINVMTLKDHLANAIINGPFGNVADPADGFGVTVTGGYFEVYRGLPGVPGITPAIMNLKVLKIKNTSWPVATSTTFSGGVNGVVGFNVIPLFRAQPKYPGVDYNNLRLTIAAASNGLASSFNLLITMFGDLSISEKWENIKITGVNDVSYLDKPIKESQIMDFFYENLSAIPSATVLVPNLGTTSFLNGTDGNPVINTDYIGDLNSKTGFFAFNSIDDIMQIAYAGEEANVHIAGAAYADLRKDLMYFGHLSNSLTTEQDLQNFKETLGIDSSYAAFFAGGLRVLNPLTNREVNISEIGDILALAANSDFSFGEWYSFAGPNRGKLKNIIGIVNNFGSASNILGMNQLANTQINTVVNRNKKNLLWGNFTSQSATSTLSFTNIRRLLIHLKKVLVPIVEQYLEEPNDFLTWRKIYMEVQPILNSLGVKRAFYGQEGEGWMWQGDQFVDKLSDLSVNDATEVGLGKYVVNLFVKDVVSLQWIQVSIILTNSGVSFEEALTQITT